MSFLKNSVLSLGALSLMGCASIFGGPKPIDITTTPLTKPPLTIPASTPFDAKDVEWIVLTEERYKQYLIDNPDTEVLFAITATDYENLAYNMVGIRNIVIQKDSIIAAYKSYYEDDNASPSTDAALSQKEALTDE